MRRLILGTAGHIDHGKTALVRALTGTDTDRLPEEKERGITIDLGFAQLELDGGTRVGIVDVPGHESFVRNMLAGASGIDFLLLAVAADEGVMPQTREHVAIAGLLGVESAVVAVTKRDLVEDEWLELVVEDLTDYLADTPLAGAPVVPVSAIDGHGLDALRQALEAAADRARRRGTEDLFRLPVDRVFTVKGTGTVVTGTVWSGVLSDGVTVRVLPQGGEARVRGLQVHGTGVESVAAGQRAAVAVAVDREEVPRGSVLLGDGAWRTARMVTGKVTLIHDTDWVLEQRQRIRFHLGTAEVMGRAVLLDGDVIGPGDEGWVQLRLESPVVARAGDRFVIRSYSPVTTIGGGVIAEPVAPKRTRVEDGTRVHLDTVLRGDARSAVESCIRQAGLEGISEAALAIRTPHAPGAVTEAVDGLGDTLVRIGGRWFASEPVTALRDRLLETVRRFHRTEPLEPGMERARLRRAAPAGADPAVVEHVIAGLLEAGTLRAMDGLVAVRDFTPVLDEAQRAARETLRSLFREAGLSPPALAELPPELRERPDFRQLLRLLQFESVLVTVSPELYMARTALEEAIARIRDALGGRDDLSPTDFKDVLDVSRKYLIPILEYLDEQGVTARHAGGRAVLSATSRQ